MRYTGIVENAINDIKDYFDSYYGVCADVFEELDDYNGFLGDDRYCDMYTLNDLLYGYSPIEVIDLVRVSSDEGGFGLGSFNPNREYFYFDTYGNLVSTDEKDYSYCNDSYTIMDILKHRSECPTVESKPELAELFDKLAEAVEEEAKRREAEAA